MTGWLERHAGLVLAATSALGVLLVLALVEGTLALLLAFPALIPQWGLVRTGLQNVYLEHGWTSIQEHLEFMEPDPELTYRMRADVSFAYRQTEFATTIRSNSRGLRDDEASLHGPEVIALGDSYTMGWGVEGDETYAQVLEAETGLRVLNAGMSSYGTAREATLLGRLDTRRLRGVVVQYFFNDYGENRAYLEAGGNLPVTPWQEYVQTVVEGRRRLVYTPLDYLRSFLGRRRRAADLEGVDDAQVAAALLGVLQMGLQRATAVAADVPVLLFVLDAWGEPLDDLPAVVDARLAADPAFAALRGRVLVVPVGSVLQPQDFYVLDPHLRAAGHRKVAAVLAAALRNRSGAVPPGR